MIDDKNQILGTRQEEFNRWETLLQAACWAIVETYEWESGLSE